MYTYKPGIDVKPVRQSVGRAYACFAVAVGLCVAIPTAWMLGALPDFMCNATVIPTYATIGLIAALGVWKMNSIIAKVEAAFKALGASRAFTFHGSIIPLMTRIGTRDGKPIRAAWFPFPWTNDSKPSKAEVIAAAAAEPDPDHDPKRMWTAEWTPYIAELVEFKAHDGRKQGYWKKVPHGPDWATFEARKAWLERECPELYEVVESWWIQCWVVPELAARHGADWETTTSEADRRVVADAHLVELVQGCLVASEPTWWGRKLGYGYEFLYIPVLQSRLKAARITTKTDAKPPPLPKKPRQIDIYLGKGFKWDTRHTQAFEDIKVRDLEEVTKMPLDQGDPRIYGLGLRDEQWIFCELKNFNQHAGIFGSTGVGKTRYVEPVVVQAIRAGFPIIVIDPKGDADLINRSYEEARKYGRGHQIHFYSLIMSTNPNVATYNPCDNYNNEPMFLGQRIGSVIVSAGDAFWKEVGIKLAREVLTMCHLVRDFLRIIDHDGNGPMPKRSSARVPKLMLMMQWANDNACDDPETASEAVDDIIRSIDGGTFKPTPKNTNVAKMMRMPHYGPREWNPTVRQVNYWGLDNTVQFFGWMLKIVNFHVYFEHKETAEVNFPEICSENDIKGGGNLKGKTYPSMWVSFKQAGVHPLEALADKAAIVSKDVQRWIPFYQYIMGNLDGPRAVIAREIMTKIRTQFDSLNSICSQEREKFLEHMSTLAAAVSRFKGARERIVCAQDPIITWERTVREDLIVYCGLGQLVDADGANGIAKMMVQDIASYIGDVYSFKEGKEKPFFLICDEIASFINEPMIDLLNKGRGAGLHCVVIGQSIPDLEACLKESSKAKQVMANLNTKIQLRAGLPEDAEAFAKLGGQVNIVQRSGGSSVTPGVGKSGNRQIDLFSSNRSTNVSLKEVPKIPQSAVVNTPRGQAFIHMMGEIYYVAQGMFPPPVTNMKDEFHMVLDGDGVMSYARATLFEDMLPEQIEQADRTESWMSIYGLMDENGPDGRRASKRPSVYAEQDRLAREAAADADGDPTRPASSTKAGQEAVRAAMAAADGGKTADGRPSAHPPAPSPAKAEPPTARGDSRPASDGTAPPSTPPTGKDPTGFTDRRTDRPPVLPPARSKGTMPSGDVD